MEVAVIGGAGAMGRAYVRNIAARPEVSKIRIVDRNEEGAAKLMEALNDPRISAAPADVLDRDSLSRAIGDAELVANFTSPQSLFTMPVAKTALELGRHYLDIGADWKETEELLALNDKVEAAGLTFLIGMGVSPGITNLLAKYGAAKLKIAEEIKTIWANYAPPMVDENGEWMENAEGGTLQDFRSAMSGEVPTFLEGRWAKIPSNLIGEYIEFRAPAGRQRVYHMGHSEPLTLPRVLTNVRSVCTLGAILPAEHGIQVRYKLMGDSGFGKVHASEQEVSDILSWGGEITVTLAGIDLEGRKVGLRYGWGDGNILRSMAAITVAPAAVATAWLANGDIVAKGVGGPERFIDPWSFFEAMAAHYTETLPSTGQGIGVLTANDLVTEIRTDFE